MSSTGRLGQGAVSPEPSEREQARREYETRQERRMRRAQCRVHLHKLERLAVDALGARGAHELTDPLWSLIEEAA